MANPTLTSFAPATLPANAGGATVITGVNFTGTTAVRVNNVTASFTVTDDTHLAVTIPNALTGVATVAVTNGSGTTTDNTHLTITPLVAPTRVSVVTLGGVFDSSNTTKFTNNLADQYAFENPNQLGGTYSSSTNSVPRTLEKLAKVKAVNDFNRRYPAQAISVPSL